MRDEMKKEIDSKTLVLCFDLQNLIGLPRGNVSCFFYKRKLNVYNLPAHASNGKERKKMAIVLFDMRVCVGGQEMTQQVQ